MKLLVIEDFKDLASLMQRKLSDEYVVEVAHTGEEGEYLAQVNIYDIIVLDLNLPDIPGTEVCERIRRGGVTAPILVLTAAYETPQKVSAFNIGADDYLTKPFTFEELRVRLRALLRRGRSIGNNTHLKVADLSLDMTQKVVRRKNKQLELRRKELDLLEYLMRNAGNIITRERLLDHLWESENDLSSNVVDVHIKYLRDKVDRPFKKKLIKTVYGLGYKIEG